MNIPRGWTDYKPYGDKVEGTKLFPFKTPLKMELVRKTIPEEQWFTPSLLKANYPQLKAVIDLTDTQKPDRYYNPKDFVEADVEHLKMRIHGGGLVPGNKQIMSFSDAVDRFVKKFSDNPDALIGVHCTHGLNRTGYFICKYMVTRLKCQPQEAIAKFHKARGYEMYRQNFIEEIISPGLHTRTKQIPDYRRAANTVRPIQTYSDHRPNWRSRASNNVEGPIPNRNFYNFGSMGRRNGYDNGASRFQGMSLHRRTPDERDYSQRSTNNRSQEGGYEDRCSSNRYRPRYQRSRRGRS